MINLECVVCGQLKMSSSSLCRWCHHKIRNIKIKKRTTFGVNHYYLFEWTEESSSFVKPLVYYLKERPLSYFTEWALYFSTIEEIRSAQLVAPPVTLGRACNHSESFSRAISQLYSDSSVLLIEGFKGDNKPQKTLRREERRRLTFQLGVGSCKLKKREWVFVDDVLASGSTLKSLINVFGLPNIILTLVYRPLFGDENEENIDNDFTFFG